MTALSSLRLLTCSSLFRAWKGPGFPSQRRQGRRRRPARRQGWPALPGGHCCTAADAATTHCTGATTWDTLLQRPASGKTKLEREKDRERVKKRGQCYSVVLMIATHSAQCKKQNTLTHMNSNRIFVTIWLCRVREFHNSNWSSLDQCSIPTPQEKLL